MTLDVREHRPPVRYLSFAQRRRRERTAYEGQIERHEGRRLEREFPLLVEPPRPNPLTFAPKALEAQRVVPVGAPSAPILEPRLALAARRAGPA